MSTPAVATIKKRKTDDGKAEIADVIRLGDQIVVDIDTLRKRREFNSDTGEHFEREVVCGLGDFACWIPTELLDIQKG
jgi:hypothetical protein